MSTAVEPRPSPLPEPRGTFTVGRSSIELVDATRRDPYAADASDPRRLVTWAWYPAEPSGAMAEYLPAPWSPTAQFLGLDVAGVPSHAIGDAEVVAGAERFPVLLMSPSGFPPLMMAGLAEDLASHGAVVVGVNHTYETTVTAFADGRVVPMNPAAVGGALGPQTGSHEEVFASRAEVCRYKAADLSFVADELSRLDGDAGSRFAGRLDVDRFGALGHSFGGVAALEWCRVDERCRAAANLDGALWSDVGTVGVPRPMLQLLADHPELMIPAEQAVAAGAAPSTEWFDAERSIAFDGWRRADERSSRGHTVRIAGATHLSFMDVPHLPLVEGALVTAMLGSTTIAPDRMSQLTADLVLAFFARYLDGTESPLLAGPSPANPELSYGPP